MQYQQATQGSWRAAAGIAGVLLVVCPGQAHADEGAEPGKPALEQARTAWDKGDYDVAEPLYGEALEKGGLAPDEALEAYIHLGATRAVLGKKAGALAALKNAALLDLSFTVPPEVGKRAIVLADQARRQQSKTGPLLLRAQVPYHVAANATTPIDVTLDAGHAATPGTTIGVTARDPDRGVSHTESARAATTTHFDLPASLSLPSTTLRVRVDWLDVHANRLASVEEQVHVQALPTALLALPIASAGTHDTAGTKHGFWHTAWPYIIGGAALAAGGAALYFATRPGDDVNVTGVRVVTH